MFWGQAHFICLVVVLGVVFEDFSLLLVVEVLDEVVEVEILAPFLAIDEPMWILDAAVNR